MRVTLPRKTTEKGMALIVSLVILLSMTLLALAAIQNTTLQERMAGNVRGENMAFQAAEAALRQGEAWLESVPSRPNAVGKGGAMDNPAEQVWGEGAPDEVGAYLAALNSLDAKYDDRWWFKWSDITSGTPTRTLWELLAVPVSNIDLQYVSAVSDTNSRFATEALSLTTIPATQPRYVVEEVGYVFDHLVIGQQRDLTSNRIRYNITGRGVDPSGRSEVLLASGVDRRF